MATKVAIRIKYLRTTLEQFTLDTHAVFKTQRIQGKTLGKNRVG